MAGSSMSTKVIPVYLKNKSEEVSIVAAGDFHVGASCFNKEAFDVFINQLIEETENRQVFLLLMGDLFDGINFNDRRRFNANEHSETADESIDFLVNKFKPLIKTKRFNFVGSLMGNHEFKAYSGDISLIHRLYKETGIEPLGFKSYIHFEFMNKKKNIFTLRTVAFHGCGNSRNVHGKVKILRDFCRENDLTMNEVYEVNHIAFYGHTHECKVEPIHQTIVNVKKNEMYERVHYGCLTGSFYDTANFNKTSYATNSGYNPLPVGYIKVIASNDNIEVKEVTENLNPKVKKVKWHV